MKFPALIIIIVILSCNQGADKSVQATVENQTMAPAAQKSGETLNLDSLATGVDKYYPYYHRTIHLSRDYLPLDTDSSSISRKAFVEKLKSGKFIVYRWIMIHRISTNYVY